MNGNQNEQEFEAKVRRILLDEDADPVGVRVERGGDDNWQEVRVTGETIAFAEGDGEVSWLEHAHAHEQEHGDPPSVLLYDKRRLAVRDDVLSPDFAAAKIEPYPGLEGVSIVEVADGDAYDLMTDFYSRNVDLQPGAPPIGRFDPDTEQRAFDAVSLMRHYFTMSHVFFWPQGPKAPSNAILHAAPNGDDRVVVVIDTGINLGHDFLANGPGQEDYLRSPADDNEWIGAGNNAGHGTAVAAVVRQHNRTAWILGARVGLGQAGANTVEEKKIVEAIEEVRARFATDPQRVVLNLSFGGAVKWTSPLYFKIQQFVGPNRQVVAAAGNVNGASDRRPMQPAAWPNVYAVASCDETGQIHEWSNYDDPKNPGWVDMARNGEVDTADGSTAAAVVHWQGTSFAAPQVAATI